MFSRLNNPPTTLCLSDLSFDELFADELAGSERLRLDAHLAVCTRCRARRAELQAERQRFQATRPLVPAWLAPEAKIKVRKRHYGALVLAALGLLALLRPQPEERAKGGELLGFYVKRGAQIHQGSVNERLSPGDQLRFTYSSERARYLAVLSVDAAQRASVYFPASGQAQRVSAGKQVALPSAVELDAVLGAERVLAIFCDQPFPLAPLESALAQRREPLPLAADCVTDQLVLHKEAPPR